MGTSVYGAARYDEDVYDEGNSLDPRKGGSFTISSNASNLSDKTLRPNEDFFKTEKGDRTFPDKYFKTKGSEGESTDAILNPMLPSLKRNPENKVAMLLEKDNQKVIIQ